MSNPYRGLPPHQFWSDAVSSVAPHELDPVVESPLLLGEDNKIATIGSCFAQHLSRFLERSGMGYWVAEQAPSSMPEDEARRRNYGVFSARYGNVYTVRQAVQLLDRAFGAFRPHETAWTRGESLVDPFRPRVEPDGFRDIDSLSRDCAAHLEAVRRVFTEADVLVFTLGLTEAWIDVTDGAVFPLAPGVSGGTFEPSRHAFVNFDYDEVSADLGAFAELFHNVNPAGHILLSVSPVPLVATYEPRHVLVSTVHSKSILRVAAGEAEQRFPFVHYFPAYEVVMAPGQGDRYFADDLRQVTQEGVAHVMRVFARHFYPAEEPISQDWTIGMQLQNRALVEMICDEIEIERAL
jgi:hypothetical protein